MSRSLILWSYTIFLLLILGTVGVAAQEENLMIRFSNTYVEHPDTQIMKIYIEKPTLLDMKDSILEIEIVDGKAVFEDGTTKRVEKLGEINEDISVKYNLKLSDDTANFYTGVKVLATLNYSYTIGLKFKKTVSAESSFLGVWPNMMDIQKYVDELEGCKDNLTYLSDTFAEKVVELADTSKVAEELTSQNKNYLETIGGLETSNGQMDLQIIDLEKNVTELYVLNQNLRKKAMNVMFYKMISGTGILMTILLIAILFTVLLKKHYYFTFKKPSLFKKTRNNLVQKAKEIVVGKKGGTKGKSGKGGSSHFKDKKTDYVGMHHLKGRDEHLDSDKPKPSHGPGHGPGRKVVDIERSSKIDFDDKKEEDS